MPIVVRTNVPSLMAQRNLARSNEALAKNLQRLSSGYRINVAMDDPGGLAISENLKAQIRGLAQAARNSQDAISMTQVAEGALSEIHSILIRLRELAVQAASDSVGSTERDFLDAEFQALKAEIDRISEVTEFNARILISGNYSATPLTFQVGIRNTGDDRLNVTLANAGTESIGTNADNLSSAAVDTQTNAQDAIDIIDAAIVDISEQRADIGAIQSRLTSAISNLEVARENVAASNSRIRDVDVAAETADMARNNILVQAGAAVLAQANAAPQIALALLG